MTSSEPSLGLTRGKTKGVKGEDVADNREQSMGETLKQGPTEKCVRVRRSYGNRC